MIATAGDGCTLAYSVEGIQSRPFLLLSNSLGTTRDMWADQMPALTSAFRVIRYDTRGHGQSDAPPGEYAIDQLGRDALAVLDAAGAAHAHVCGLSLGGVTGMWLGVHAADRVDSLVLASTAARIGTVETWNQRIRQVLDGGTASIADAVMARWFTDAFRAGSPDRVVRVSHDAGVDIGAGLRRLLCGAARDRSPRADSEHRVTDACHLGGERSGDAARRRPGDPGTDTRLEDGPPRGLPPGECRAARRVHPGGRRLHPSHDSVNSSMIGLDAWQNERHG